MNEMLRGETSDNFDSSPLEVEHELNERNHPSRVSGSQHPIIWRSKTSRAPRGVAWVINVREELST